MKGLSSEFPRYRVNPFGIYANWMNALHPCGMNNSGTIVGYRGFGAGSKVGFIFDGAEIKYFGGETNLQFCGIDDENFAIGVTGPEESSFVTVHADESHPRYFRFPKQKHIGICTVTGNGDVLGDVQVMDPCGSDRGYYAGMIARHIKGEMQPFAPLALTSDFAQTLSKVTSSRARIQRSHLRVNVANAKGQFLITAVRVGPNLESYPIIREPNGEMHFALGDLGDASPCGSTSVAFSDDGSFSIQAKCSIPPDHKVYWCNPKNLCKRCGRFEHALFVERAEERRCLSPQVCACISPIRNLSRRRNDSDYDQWVPHYKEFPGHVKINATKNNFWVGEVGSPYGGLIGATPEGNGHGAIWRRTEHAFAFSLLEHLIEPAHELMILEAVAINDAGQIACSAIRRADHAYIAARLDPIVS